MPNTKIRRPRIKGKLPRRAPHLKRPPRAFPLNTRSRGKRDAKRTGSADCVISYTDEMISAMVDYLHSNIFIYQKYCRKLFVEYAACQRELQNIDNEIRTIYEPLGSFETESMYDRRIYNSQSYIIALNSYRDALHVRIAQIQALVIKTSDLVNQAGYRCMAGFRTRIAQYTIGVDAAKTGSALPDPKLIDGKLYSVLKDSLIIPTVDNRTASMDTNIVNYKEEPHHDEEKEERKAAS